jgi:flagella basal body P-ring formation protein FlgA
MSRLLPLLVLVAGVSPVWAQAPAPADAPQQQIAAALLGELRSRLGREAVITLGNVHVALREDAAGSLAVVPSPQAVLDAPVDFVVIGAGASGKPKQVGRGRADVFVSVPHVQAARTLVRGSVLTADDLVSITGDPGGVPLKRLPTALDLVGATLRRDTVSGDVLTLQDAVPPLAIRAGDTVQALATIGSVQVWAELTAVDNGAEGAVVRVVNRETRRELRARVLRAGVVEVMHD